MKFQKIKTKRKRSVENLNNSRLRDVGTKLKRVVQSTTRLGISSENYFHKSYLNRNFDQCLMVFS